MVRLWFQKSAEDLKISKLILSHASRYHEMLGALVFHSQQAAEKALKGYLAHKKVRFDKTHDIEETKART